MYIYIYILPRGVSCDYFHNKVLQQLGIKPGTRLLLTKVQNYRMKTWISILPYVSLISVLIQQHTQYRVSLRSQNGTTSLHRVFRVHVHNVRNQTMCYLNVP